MWDFHWPKARGIRRFGHAENGEKLGMDFCRSATTRNLAYKIYKVGIFPKSVAGKCPKKFYKAEFG